MKLLVRELSGEDNWRKAETAVHPSTVVREFFDWQFAENLFEYAVIAPVAKGRLMAKLWGGNNSLPSVCLGREDAKEHYSVLLEHALRGFELVVATKASKDSCNDFFSKFGYIPCRSTDEDSDVSIFNAAWNRKQLSLTIDVALRLGGEIFCCFSHDADPIYIFEKQA